MKPGVVSFREVRKVCFNTKIRTAKEVSVIAPNNKNPPERRVF
jgi:hypothetical protein